MKPSKGDQHAIVDLVDMLLDKGAVVEADVLITVADIPLVGLKLRAALAGMATMREYGMFEEWDEIQRELSREDESRHPLKSHRVSASKKNPKPDER